MCANNMASLADNTRNFQELANTFDLDNFLAQANFELLFVV